MTSPPAVEELTTSPSLGIAAEDLEAIDREWEEVFWAGYGQRLWNVGCG